MTLTRDCLCPVVITRGADQQAVSTKFDMRDDPGRPVQVDPIKPAVKPPGTKRSKLKCDILLSIYAFEFNLRRCTRV